MEFLIIGAVAVVLFIVVFAVDKWLDKKDAEKKSVKSEEPKAQQKPKKKKTTRKKKVVKKTKQTK